MSPPHSSGIACFHRNEGYGTLTTAHCLTVEVKSTPVQTGAEPSAVHAGTGYMITFTLPANMAGQDPRQHPSFDRWAAAVRDAVIAAGDPFTGDNYTRKLALAHLMHELAELNRRFPIRIGGQGEVPAVQVHSTNALAPQIELDFTDEDGDFTVVERNPTAGPSAEVREQGRIGLVAAARKVFPFDKPATPPPANHNAAKKPQGRAPKR